MEPLLLDREDRAILDLEGPHVVGHTCKVLTLEAPAPSLADLRALIATRLPRAPMLLRRLGESPAGPVWLQGESLDVAKHVVDGGNAANDAELRRKVGELFARHLDRSRPLWHLQRIGLPGDRAALVWRIHHALADGTTSIRLGEALLWDLVPHAGRPEPATPGPAQHLDNGDQHRRRGHLAAFLRREFAESLHRSPFDGRIGSRRSIAFAAAPLSEMHDAAHRIAGASINDAVLSVVSGGLRRWLLEHHEDLGTLRLRVPVSLHHEGDDPGNRDSFFTLPVSLHEEDPAARLRQIHAASQERKAEHDAERLESFLDHLGEVSPGLRRLAERLEAGPRSFALAVSNVPGPRQAVTIAGAPVRSMHSLAEVGLRHGLRVSVVSLAESLGFGICADPGIVPDVARIAAGIEADAANLVAAAG